MNLAQKNLVSLGQRQGELFLKNIRYGRVATGLETGEQTMLGPTSTQGSKGVGNSGGMMGKIRKYDQILSLNQYFLPSLDPPTLCQWRKRKRGKRVFQVGRSSFRDVRSQGRCKDCNCGISSIVLAGQFPLDLAQVDFTPF